MNVSRSFDERGAQQDKIEFAPDELEAIKKAEEIAAFRFAEAGVEYGPRQKEMMSWCFAGALRIGGIPELMRYVTETRIAVKKKTVCVGYADAGEKEERK